MPPANWFSKRAIDSKLEAFAISEGIFPLNWFLPRLKNFKFLRSPISTGIDPDKLLSKKFK